MPPGEEGRPQSPASGHDEGKTKAPAPGLSVAVGQNQQFKSFRLTDLGERTNRRGKEITALLSEMDRNKDGVINADELVDLLEGVVKSRRERRFMVFGLVAMTIFSLCTIGAVVGLTYAVVDSLKDTEVNGNKMMVKGSTIEVVKVSSADFSIVDGAAVTSQVAHATNATATSSAAAVNATAAVPDNVLRTATYMGTPMPFTSMVDVRTLMELRYLYIKGPGKVELALMVLGVARVPLVNSVHGDVVRIVTSVGTITLDDTVLMFSSNIADVFMEAGFRVAHNRRVLLGAYSVLGFFNFIRNLEAFNTAEPNIAKSQLPEDNFSLKLKIYEPCVLPANPTHDRCVVVQPEKAPASDGIPPQAPPSAPPMPPMVGIDLPEDLTPGGGNRRRQLREAARVALGRGIATRPYRSLQGVEASGQDLAGVEVLDGKRYMTRNETVISWNGALQVIYQYALAPYYEKVELNDVAQSMTHTWQRMSASLSSSSPSSSVNSEEVVAGALFCSSSPLVDRPSVAAVPPTVDALPEGFGFNYTYEGISLLEGDVPARHFRLVVMSNGTVTQTVEFWDTHNGQQPLAFAFEGPDSGRVLMRVMDYHAINSESTEAQTAFWTPPKPEECLSPVMVPRVLDSFNYIGGSRVAGIPDQDAADEEADLSPAERRRLEAETEARATLWEQLDHANGTGEWPQWALDIYGGVKPSTSRRVLQSSNSCPKMSGGIVFPKGMEPCEGEMGFTKNFNVLINMDCSGEVAPGTGLTVHGLLNVDTCQRKYEGCITLNWEIPGDSILVKGANAVRDLPSVEFVKGCVSYDPTTGIWTLSMVAEPKLQPDWLDKAFADSLNKFLATYVIKGWSGNVWIEEVTVSWDIAFDPVGTIVNAINLVYELGSDGVAWIQDQASLEVKNGQPKVQTGSTMLFDQIADWVGGLFGGRRRHLASLIDKSKLPKTGIKITKEEFKIVKKGQPVYIVGGPPTNQEAVVTNRHTTLTVYNEAAGSEGTMAELFLFHGLWMTMKWCGSVTNRGSGQRYTFSGTPMTGYTVRMLASQGSGKDDQSLTAVRYKCNDGSVISEDEADYGTWQPWASCDSGAYIVGARVRVEPWQGFDGDDTVINSIQFRCNKGTGSTAASPLNVHNGYWGDFGNWVMCPTNTFVCGVQLRVDRYGYQIAWAFDRKGVTGMKIVCCRF